VSNRLPGRARGGHDARRIAVAAGAWARRNWLFVLLLATGIGLRALVGLAYSPAFLDSDAYAYLERSVTLSPAGSFHPFLYPLFMRPLIVPGTVAWIPVVQHGIGIMVAALLYTALSRIGVPRPVAALGVAPVLLDGYQLLFEHEVLSETLFELFAVGALVVLVWGDRPTYVNAGAAGVLAGAASLTRFVGLFLIVAMLVYAAIRRFGWRRLATLVACFGATLGIYAVALGAATGSAKLTDRNGFFLYGRVVEFADCSDVRVPREERVFCPRAGREPTGTGLFESGLPDRVRQDPRYNARALAFSKRMILAMPGSYAKSVGSDFLDFFLPGQPVSRRSDDDKWRFPTTVTGMGARGYAARHDTAPPPATRIRLDFSLDGSIVPFLRSYQKVVWSWGPLLAAELVLGLVGAALGWRRRAGRTLAPEALLFSLAGIGVLLFPPLFAVYHFRYAIPAVPLLAAGAAVGAAVVHERVVSAVRSPRLARRKRAHAPQ